MTYSYTMPHGSEGDAPAARKLVQYARQTLDDALGVLPHEGDTTVATPALLALLLEAAQAQRHLDAVELSESSAPTPARAP